MANLEVRDIHLDQGVLVVRNGKGGKDAVVPLNATIGALLRSYIKPGMAGEQKLLGLKPSTISSEVEWFARKAGVSLHCHSLRHYFGTKLIEGGANPEAVRQLMRQERLDTTQRYISLAGKGLRDAVELLDQKPGPDALELRTVKGINPQRIRFDPNYDYYLGSLRVRK